MKATLELSWREDGGLRVTSASHPGLLLSHSRADLVMLDVLPALEAMGFAPEQVGETRSDETRSAIDEISVRLAPEQPPEKSAL